MLITKSSAIDLVLFSEAMTRYRATMSIFYNIFAVCEIAIFISTSSHERHQYIMLRLVRKLVISNALAAVAQCSELIWHCVIATDLPIG